MMRDVLAEARQQILDRRRAPGGGGVVPTLHAFVESTTQITLEDWQKVICARLDAMDSQQGQRLLVHGPPQFGKSLVISQRWPAHSLGKNPLSRFRLACYNLTHAERFSKVNLSIMQSADYQATFPHPDARVPDRASAEEWSTVGRARLLDANPSFKALGLGTGFTGLGVDCLLPGTLIKTNIGDIDVAHLSLLYCKPLVLAYNHATQSLTWRRIVATREILADAYVEITTATGRVLRVTGNHPIYVEGHGYKDASLLSPGDRLIGVASECMPALRRVQTTGKPNVQAMLSAHSARNDNANVPVVSEVIRANTLRTREAITQRMDRLLLFSALFKRASRCQERADVSAVRHSNAGPTRNKVLFTRMLKGGASSEGTERKGLPVVWRNISAAYIAYGLLFTSLCGRGTFTSNEGRWQFAFQTWQQLCKMVRGDAPVHFRAGRLALCGVQDSRKQGADQVAWTDSRQEQPGYSSHQRRCAEQHAGKFDYALQEMSCDTPQIEKDTVAVVRHICGSNLRVYDIQVEDDHNFFADGILVHNCLVIDDPYKNRQDALSEAVNAAVWGWWSDVVLPRLNPATNVVVMFHRWQDNDLAGRLLQQGGWELLRFPAIADGGADDPTDRELGDPLSPRYPIPYLEEVKRKQGSSFYALYQGTPRAPEGDYFKRGWFGAPVGAVPAGSTYVRYWDLAAGTSGQADYTAGVLMARSDAGYYYVVDVQHGRWAAAERNATIKQRAALDARQYDSVATYIEQAPGLSMEPTLDLIRQLAGHSVYADKVTKDKVSRAEPFQAQAQAGNIKIVDADWNGPYLDELCAFPTGDHDDMVDGSSGAFNKIAGVDSWLLA